VVRAGEPTRAQVNACHGHAGHVGATHRRQPGPADIGAGGLQSHQRARPAALLQTLERGRAREDRGVGRVGVVEHDLRPAHPQLHPGREPGVLTAHRRSGDLDLRPLMEDGLVEPQALAHQYGTKLLRLLKGRLVEPGVALEVRPRELGVVLEDRPVEPGDALEGRPMEHRTALEGRPGEPSDALEACPLERGEALEGRPVKPGVALEGHPAVESGGPLEDRSVEPGAALEDRPAVEPGAVLEGHPQELGAALEGRPIEPGDALEGRPVESGVCQDRVAAVILGDGGKEAPKKLLRYGHAACIQPAVIAEPLKCRVQVGMGGVRPALVAGREPDANAAAVRALLPVPATVVVCHAVLARRRALPARSMPRQGCADKTSSAARSRSGRPLRDVVWYMRHGGWPQLRLSAAEAGHTPT